MTKGPLYIQNTNLSCAWMEAFLEIMKPGVKEILPLVVTVTDLANGQPTETKAIRQALDDALVKNSKFSCDTVANTIFPLSLWDPEKEGTQLFDRYRTLLPWLKKVESNNKYGLYFERLIAFGPEKEKVNQLEHIIRTYKGGNHRRSALQASVFDPSIDHTHQRRRGFPCMQQVAFAPHGNYELSVTGFYATQHLFERAYGNYLGLCNLGHFIAHELGLQLTQMTCVANVAKLGDVNKRDIQSLLDSLEYIKSSTQK